MLEIKDLVFEVMDEKGNTLRILDNVSINIPDGKFFVITGPNGGGKSTLARLIMGLEKPSSGKIIYNGTDITEMDVTERAKLGIGYAFQQPPRFKGLTVNKMLSLAAGKTLTEKECCTYLAKVGLCSAEYVKRELDGSLSGGEMKRIEIATLMARKPELSIFDEPEAGIDLWSFSMLVETFKNMQRLNAGATTVIISHQERIMTLADEMIIVADGKIKSIGARDEMLPKLMREFSSPKCVKVED